MANIELKFICDYDETCNIKCFEEGELIKIILNEYGIENTIHLDISTAIKFAKTVRTEINKAKAEVDNG
tara:strand:- start:394 stop:600 length:207 start_codon:yes stop_codon:yes gene_type:complete